MCHINKNFISKYVYKIYIVFILCSYALDWEFYSNREKKINWYITIYCDKPNNFNALKAVAKATSSGFLPIRAAIISTIAGNEHGSFRWNVQYLREKKTHYF